jgi:CheY-like chemotaxis protein
MDKPEILVVEDEPEARDILANELQARGARIQIAADEREALDLFYKRASSIDAVVTDMRLHGERKSDRSGGELGKKLKRIAPNLPVYCNSAIDVREQFPFFDAYFIKGSFGRPENDIFENLNNIVEQAANYENTRFSEIPEALVNLKIKYRITDPDFLELIGSRRLLELERTALLLFHQALERAEGVTLGDAADQAPFPNAEICLIEPGSPMAADTPIRKAVPFVVSLDEGVWIAELFGFPLIYSYAESRKAAIQHLLALLSDYYREEFTEQSKGGVVAKAAYVDHIKFSTFLRLLFT